MSDGESTMEIYRNAAQACVDLHAHIWHEYGEPREDALETAESLYKRHGPFELDWSRWPYEGDPLGWYDG